MRTPRLYLGTMTFSWSQTSSKVDELVAKEMVGKFAAFTDQTDVVRIDTARIYAGGKTEPCVAHALVGAAAASSKMFAVGTKAHPSQQGGLSPAGIKAQFEESKVAMPGVHFSEFYLHQPDPEHSLLESLQCLHNYHSQGLISAVGMSNYHASEMERAFELCLQHGGLTPPTVYQGLYNPLNRLVEEELLPILRKHNCSFVAYNPLAAGLLAGKYTAPVSDEDKVPKGRFKDNPNYLPRFYTGPNFEAVELIRQACDAASISMVEATYRWLLFHSSLGTNDGILLGASSVQQLDQNLAACKVAAPLPGAVVAAFEEAWKVTKAAGVFPYWRSYSSDMPDRKNRDQGASYEAAKKK